MQQAGFVLVALGFFAAVTLAQDAASDLKKMEGKWKAVVHEADGKPTPKEETDKVDTTLVVKDGKYEIYFAGKFADRGTIKLDPTKKPKQIDVTGEEGTDKGKTMKGIYEIDADHMQVCFAQAGSERPTEFKTKEGTFQVLLKYTRIKK